MTAPSLPVGRPLLPHFSALLAFGLVIATVRLHVAEASDVKQLEPGRIGAPLVAPAFAIAEAGARVSESERLFLLLYRDRIESSYSLRPLYMTGDCDADALAIPVPIGHNVIFPGLARTLRRLAEAGPMDFYYGAIASEIAADLSKGPAFVRADDLARVPASIIEVAPLRGRYRDLDVISLPSPGGGGLVIETLHILDAFPPEVFADQPWARIQAVVESIRLSFADAKGVPLGREVGEGPFLSPWLRPARGVELARRIRLGQALPQERLPSTADAHAFSDRDTTHLSVVDREGNAVSLTQSLGRTWGSTYVTPGLGFPYNAFLEGFDVEDPNSQQYLRPGAPLLTAIAPTIFLRSGRPVLVLGAAGSSRIPSAIANVAVGVFDGHLGIAEAVAAPRASWSEGRVNRGMRLEVAPPVTLEDVDFLRAAGYDDLETYAPGPETSNFGALNAVGWDATAKVWEAGADSRRQGFAAVPARAPVVGRSQREERP